MDLLDVVLAMAATPDWLGYGLGGALLVGALCAMSWLHGNYRITWACGSLEPVAYPVAPFRCTRPVGHDGEHRAVVDRLTVARWTQRTADAGGGR